jgi:hypothetical protein
MNVYMNLKLGLIGLMLLGLAACGGGSGGSGGGTPPDPKPDPKPVVSGCMDADSIFYNPKATKRGKCGDASSQIKRDTTLDPDNGFTNGGTAAGGDFAAGESAYIAKTPTGYNVADGFKPVGRTLDPTAVVELEANIRYAGDPVGIGGTAEFSAKANDAYRLRGVSGGAKDVVDFTADTGGGAPLRNRGTATMTDICPLFTGKGGRAVAGCAEGTEGARSLGLSFGTMGNETKKLTQ